MYQNSDKQIIYDFFQLEGVSHSHLFSRQSRSTRSE